MHDVPKPDAAVEEAHRLEVVVRLGLAPSAVDANDGLRSLVILVELLASQEDHLRGHAASFEKAAKAAFDKMRKQRDAAERRADHAERQLKRNCPLPAKLDDSVEYKTVLVTKALLDGLIGERDAAIACAASEKRARDAAERERDHAREIHERELADARSERDAAERERDLLRDKWKQMEAYGFDSPTHVFARLEAAERAAERGLADERLAQAGLQEVINANVRARESALAAKARAEEALKGAHAYRCLCLVAGMMTAGGMSVIKDEIDSSCAALRDAAKGED